MARDVFHPPYEPKPYATSECGEFIEMLFVGAVPNIRLIVCWGLFLGYPDLETAMSCKFAKARKHSYPPVPSR